jgi:hypothetical protein
MSMTAGGIVRSVAVVLGAAALWAVPVTGAQAVGYHPNPKDPNLPQHHGAQAQEGSPGSGNGTPEGCFRRYDERCERAREARRRR